MQPDSPRGVTAVCGRFGLPHTTASGYRHQDFSATRAWDQREMCSTLMGRTIRRASSERLRCEPYGQRREGDPDGHYYHSAHPAEWLVLRIARFFAALGEDRGWDHSYRERDSERDDEYIVEVSEDRDRVGYQVYGTEGVRDHDRGEGPRIPWHPRVLVGQVQRVDFDLETSRPPLESLDKVTVPGLWSQK